MIFKTIGRLGRSDTTHGILYFSSLIYSILTSQDFVKKELEGMESPPRPIKASYKLIHETYIIDLSQPFKKKAPAANIALDIPPSVITSSALLLRLETKLAEAHRQIQY
ncbi:hypothetical protein Pfo_020347 [Paulownia fortunei]|nr:hypothetical protein Pfo_020347 [Paulownia fortunei]